MLVESLIVTADGGGTNLLSATCQRLSQASSVVTDVHCIQLHRVIVHNARELIVTIRGINDDPHSCTPLLPVTHFISLSSALCAAHSQSACQYYTHRANTEPLVYPVQPCTMSATIDEQYVRDHFQHLCADDVQSFFKQISPAARLHVMGHITGLSAEYVSLDDFIKRGFSQVGGRLVGHQTFTLNHCMVSGQRATVELTVDVDSVKQKNGKPFPNTHCWVVHYDQQRAMDEARIYLDGALLEELMTTNTL